MSALQKIAPSRYLSSVSRNRVLRVTNSDVYQAFGEVEARIVAEIGD